MLSINWYIESPIDFEHKNYLLLQYLQDVDRAYQEHQLNPYLLHTEKLIDELSEFLISRERFRESIRKKTLNLSKKIHWIVTDIEETDDMQAVVEIAEYSKPILESKITLGYKLLKKYPQILW